jgi:hypothetical protein
MSRRTPSGSLLGSASRWWFPLPIIFLMLAMTLTASPSRGSDVTPVEPDPLLALSIFSPYPHTITTPTLRLSPHILRTAPQVVRWTIELVNQEIDSLISFFEDYHIHFDYLGADDYMTIPPDGLLSIPRPPDRLSIFFFDINAPTGGTQAAWAPANAAFINYKLSGGMHLTHEVGHCLGLLHPNHPDGPECTAGADSCRVCDDLVCDTRRLISWPRCDELTCPACVFADSSYVNVMQTWDVGYDLSQVPYCDCCRQIFTEGQVNRMLAMIEYSDILWPMLVTPMTFDNRSVETGLDYPGTPYSSAPIDFDRDGLLDLIITIREGADLSRVYKNTRVNENGVPEFRDRTDDIFNPNQLPQAGLRGLAVADYNGDGWPDFFAADGLASRLYENNGDGTFTDRADTLLPPDIAAGCWAAAWGDYDKDGQPDLLLVGGYDVNLDDDLDANDGSGAVILLRNQRPAAETFADVTVAAGLGSAMIPLTAASASVSWTDIDLDGHLDFFIGSVHDFTGPGGSPSLLYVNNGDSTFTLGTNRLPDLNELQQVTGVAWADMDNDGDLDLVVSEQSYQQHGPRIFWNDGNGWFHESPPAVLPVSSPTTGLRLFDSDLDGRTDLLLLPKLAADRPWLFMNKATPSKPGRFVDESAWVLAETGRVDGAVTADYNGDGDFDLYLGRPVSTDAFYYRNIQKAGPDEPVNRWVGLKLAPHLPANTEVGAVVTFTAGDLVQTQIVDGGSGRGGQMDQTLICGLGEYEGSVAATIRWPNGVEQTAALTPGMVNVIQDATQFAILPDSVSIIQSVDPISGALSIKFRWLTNYASHKSSERIEIEAPSYPCDVIPAALTADWPGVTYRQEKAGGGFKHELTWSGSCVPSCLYTYTIRSSTDKTPASVSGSFRVRVCPAQ